MIQHRPPTILPTHRALALAIAAGICLWLTIGLAGYSAWNYATATDPPKPSAIPCLRAAKECLRRCYQFSTTGIAGSYGCYKPKGCPGIHKIECVYE